MRPDPTGSTTEEILAGGGVNVVVRVGDTVRRPAGPWTPAVHALLGHLAARGFTGAPRAHGLDGRGREILDFVPGTVACDPVPPYVRDDATLRAVAGLLRAYHDATTGFTPPGDAAWYFPPREPAEVVCHADIAPYNCVFRDGAPVAFIDFDTAHPGPRLWDVAYAAYRFVPLTAQGHGEAPTPVPEQARRLGLFCDAYGLAAADRAALTDVVGERLHGMARLIREKAAAGDAAFAAHLAGGHDALYLADAAHVARHALVLQEAVR
ncbi:phosphotransferase enzyme family protein [Nonomuraea harbinensis]|uniref:Phosphotransferase enzyme family protein n=1 Tax=Nonomuraea harbinensis TaxID=1286938 RepID=A0ABW1BWZ5_9ACTN|nr:aminoglycoside phosphotransferase family protein [Nonomuraea harbinensis]